LNSNLKPWKPGQSGNPGGRPKKRILDEHLSEMLEANDGEDAKAIARVLIEKAKDGELRAVQLIAERTQGRPTQAVELSGIDGRRLEIQNMTDEQLDQRIADLAKELGLNR
jgi:hypothetical protein